MILLVDIGNSRLKWSFEKNGEMGSMHAIDYQSAQFHNILQQIWSTLAIPQGLAIASVTAEKISSQIINIAKQLWPDIEIFIAKSSASDLGVSNAYQQADKLGVDRWLGMIALQHYFIGYKCIIDCGTAITLDCLDNNGQHLGGLISPGLQLMKSSLYQGTENLSMSNQLYPVGLANSTEAAIDTGVLYSAVGFIEKAINSFDTFEAVVLTGGDAQLLMQYLQFKSNMINITIQPNFVLKGLALLYRGQTT